MTHDFFTKTIPMVLLMALACWIIWMVSKAIIGDFPNVFGRFHPLVLAIGIGVLAIALSNSGCQMRECEWYSTGSICQ